MKTDLPEESEYLSSDRFLTRSVREMEPDEQPREKLMRKGADHLSDAELIAILLRTGTRKLNVIETSRALLKEFNGLNHLVRKDWQQLRIIPGIAKVKAITLEAAFELARRIRDTETKEDPQFTSPDLVANYFGPKLRTLTHEVFMVVCLNNNKHMICYKTISKGGRTATIVEPATVMKQAIMNDACSVILIHNHPSGGTKPSEADKLITQRLVDCGKLLGIPVDDHIIIAGQKHLSFRDKNML
ncbi:MAG: DNA repair protein RadC [Bacteroidota bacterium]